MNPVASMDKKVKPRKKGLPRQELNNNTLPKDVQFLGYHSCSSPPFYPPPPAPTPSPAPHNAIGTAAYKESTNFGGKEQHLLFGVPSSASVLIQIMVFCFWPLLSPLLVSVVICKWTLEWAELNTPNSALNHVDYFASSHGAPPAALRESLPAGCGLFEILVLLCLPLHLTCQKMLQKNGAFLESYWESGNSGSKSKTRAPRPGRCMQRVHFALEVTEELESWPEKDTHERKWASHT
ncbi:hypothetical protein HPP92_025018 [Vanilla planifolia]|uniref:Uncharacterized protein n=1 Tax=Vanilla planifolia TaxID=51239 RepID=A0A835U8L9_VANPL|nr:hypothetical protein HPP92_025018 [Vanilla planifolia]